MNKSLKRQLDKEERLAHANELIQLIASHGRRFFWSADGHIRLPTVTGRCRKFEHGPVSRVARLELRNGRVWFFDSYTDQAIYTHHVEFRSRWRGFSGGGTLRALVEDMREYVMHGKKISRHRVPCRGFDTQGFERNVWGYATDEAEALHAKAILLPILE